MWFQNGNNKVAIELQVVKFWSEIILTEIMCMIWPNCTPFSSITIIKHCPSYPWDWVTGRFGSYSRLEYESRRRVVLDAKFWYTRGLHYLRRLQGTWHAQCVHHNWYIFICILIDNFSWFSKSSGAMNIIDKDVSISSLSFFFCRALTVEGETGLFSGVHLRHASLERNKRCLLSYV